MQRSQNEQLPCGFIMRKRTERHPAFLHYSSVMLLVFMRGSTDGLPSGSPVSETETALDEEQKQYYSPSDNASFDLSGTLDEITRRIVLSVYQEENQNQSRTAARLGISRTTLWRMLK